MVKEIVLNDTVIQLENYKEETVNNLRKVVLDFKVTSEDYHDIAVLLYEGTFNVKVPERNLAFRGTIQQYSTSITNLYEKGEVGDYHVCLLEVKQ
ncbi:hypothetical protein JOD29_004029 [Lysinibacillus composti]|uniref:DUF3219 family protein n=1 Tax=Lysinibacillus composti TaxID=720633 RepID=A0A3N9U2U7_9BACI|nr:DUF3219 family protein [Lysinibacillus composti]MBM7610697.1 hypothetical protein [Lysinibacillus composti]RQW70960.1 DUF3219 family protein [Lysinibacillus composti]